MSQPSPALLFVAAFLSAFSGNAAVQTAQTPAPLARAGHVMVAPRSGGVLLFSGQIIDNSGRPADPLWQWNGRAWRALQAGPENRTLPAAAYDTDRDTLVVFGGSAVGSDDRFNETWPRDHHAFVEDSGGNLLIRNRVGIGGEYGIFGGEGGGLTIASLNGVVHFAPAERQRGARPFVSGGYTRLSNGEGTFNAWNAGAGVDIWARERVGVRVELRDHIRPDNRGNVHYWSIRAGVAIR